MIGEKLGAANVFEGSVRREGDKARITAQLIRASDGIHLWSETYDRTLTDTLAVQVDIAENVADVLTSCLTITSARECAAKGSRTSMRSSPTRKACSSTQTRITRRRATAWSSVTAGE